MADQDEFAQTRGADDLFDDEIIPISGNQEIQHVTETTTEQEQQQQPTDTATQQPAPTSRRNRGHGRGAAHADGGRGRGRGRGRGGRGSSDAGPRKEAAAKETTTEAVETPKEIEPTEKKDDIAGEEKKEEDTEGKTATKTDSARVPAVRGDRSGTGGIKKVSQRSSKFFK